MDATKLRQIFEKLDAALEHPTNLRYIVEDCQ